MRKLASIQKIKEINPIGGKDRIELATVLGWNCIVKKGQFKPGDMGIYIEPDSQLYPHPAWDSFLAQRKYKIKTLKMAGVVSQGLLLPLSTFDEDPKRKITTTVEGTDLTEHLCVKHIDDNTEEPRRTPRKSAWWMRYAPLRKLAGKLKGHDNTDFPKDFVKETEEPNVQTLPETWFDSRMGEWLVVTEKLEGQSATYIFRQKKGILNRILQRKEFLVCSHHRRLPVDDNSNWWKIANKNNMKAKLKQFHKLTGADVVLQGEIVGPKIQKNIYGLKELEFYVFGGKIERKYRPCGGVMTVPELNIWCSLLSLKTVPLLTTVRVSKETTSAQYWLEKADGKSVLADTLREGIVVRTTGQGKESFKARSRKYLLKED